jgi:hypothetical protein
MLGGGDVDNDYCPSGIPRYGNTNFEKDTVTFCITVSTITEILSSVILITMWTSKDLTFYDDLVTIGCGLPFTRLQLQLQS